MFFFFFLNDCPINLMEKKSKSNDLAASPPDENITIVHCKELVEVRCFILFYY